MLPFRAREDSSSDGCRLGDTRVWGKASSCHSPSKRLFAEAHSLQHAIQQALRGLPPETLGMNCVRQGAGGGRGMRVRVSKCLTVLRVKACRGAQGQASLPRSMVCLAAAAFRTLRLSTSTGFAGGPRAKRRHAPRDTHQGGSVRGRPDAKPTGPAHAAARRHVDTSSFRRMGKTKTGG